MPYSPEYLELWTSLAFENNDKKRLYSYQSFQGRDRKRQTDELFWRNSNELGLDLTGLGFILDNDTGEIELVVDGSGENPVTINRWITFTDGTNSVDADNGADTFTFEGLNDATVTLDPATKKVIIDVTASGGLWSEDSGTNSLYPTTIGRKVGINTTTPAEQFTVKGVTQIDPATIGIIQPESILKFKNTHHTFTELVSVGGTPSSTTDIFGSFYIDNSDTSLLLTDEGNIFQNNLTGTNRGVLENPAFEIYNNNSETSIEHGLVVVTDSPTNFNKTLLMTYNENAATPLTPEINAQEFFADGGVRFRAYRNGVIPTTAFLAGSADVLTGFSSDGTLVKFDLKHGIDTSILDVWGEKTISHGCLSEPLTIVVSKEFALGAPIHAQTVGEQIEIVRGTITATTFDIRITDAGGVPLSNKFRTVHFIAIAGTAV